MAPLDIGKEEVRDLGFGTRVSEQSRDRLLNRDGSFNVVRKRLPFLQSLSPYHSLITMSWSTFLVALGAGYIIFNLIFALAYVLCGDGALKGSTAVSTADRFLEAFFFSVQTSTTIGYSLITPHTLAANVLVMVEAMMGLLGFATATGMVFARFSKPNAKILFSNHAVIAPYRGITAFEFRIANQRSTQLIQVEVNVVLTRIETDGTRKIRKYYPLSLERSSVLFFPLNWTIVHPIDEDSPLRDVSRESFFESDPEILILVSGMDETFSQSVHARSSYKVHEIVWGARFKDMFARGSDGKIAVDLQLIHEIEPVQES